MKGLMSKGLIGAMVVSLMAIMPEITLAEETEEEVAMEEVVVTATRTSTPTEEVGSSITVITAEEMEARGQTTVREVLKGTLGLDVWATGGPGQMSSVSLRGANSYHTLVLIDGVEMNDPTGANRGFNFANLTVDNIERIEILRGPQSPLYGADAMGGVINIITKKGKGKPRFYLGSEGGRYETWREFGGASMGNERVNLSLAFSHNSTDGFSAAADDLPGNSEDDKWENTSASTRIGFVLSENIDLDLIARFQNGRTHLDNGAGPYQDQDDYHVDEQRIFTRAQAHIFALDGLWEQTLAYGFADHSRDYRDSPWGDSDFDGKKHEISWQNNLYLHETNILTLGVEYEREEMDNHTDLDESNHTTSFFVQDQIKLWDCSFTTIGLRWDDHEKFGSETTFRITQAFLLRDWGTKFKGSYGTGFRAPSLYELYAPPFWGMPIGNPDLDPEESEGWDIGIEQSLFDNCLTIGITYFYNDFDDLIDYDWSMGYINISEAKTSGLESFIELIPFRDLTLRLNYTYTDTEDDDGSRLLRRPLHKVGFNTGYRFLERGRVNLNILYVGERDDSYWDSMTFTARDVITDNYVVVNLTGSFDVSEHFQVFGRIDNLFDENYYESYGYGTAGFSAYGGLKITF
ncbi:MAG: TonB-dependent receptor [Deltaproteobacteria bacterium]|nr:TonB-dependent receptor [Deltaproteobacteria bacterium]